MKPLNSIVWLDLRSEDLENARRFIKAMEGEGVLDELGFLALQGRFADIFYPATSVLMSAPRYLYFVAGIYRQLEREWTPGLRAERESQRRMDRLRAVLVKHEKKGVIGKEAKERVKQWPSAVYWASMKRLGMFRQPLSERAYQDRAFRGRASNYEDDDGVTQTDDRVAFWDADLPVLECLHPEGVFTEDTSFRLTRAEARDLFKRYKERFSTCLLVHLVESRRGVPELPWETPAPPAFLRLHLEQARLVSLLARGATLHYYSLLMEARIERGFENGDFDLNAHAADWWAVAARPLKAWRVREDLCGLPSTGELIRRNHEEELSFMERWQRSLASARSARQWLEDTEGRALVKGREKAVKKAKSRFRSEPLLQRWAIDDRRQPGPYQFEYRHSVGRRFALDIQKALPRR